MGRREQIQIKRTRRGNRLEVRDPYEAIKADNSDDRYEADERVEREIALYLRESRKLA